MATTQQIQKFNANRKTDSTPAQCYAPWLSMNFDQTGHVTACCFNRTYVLGKYPDQKLTDIWTGKNASALRQAMKVGNFSLGCQLCEKMIEEGNDESVLIKHFDDYVEFLPPLPQPQSWFRKLISGDDSGFLPPPTVFEFELSNICNLECIMCGGKWSSSIRLNREKMPGITNPYDAVFVQQIKEFLPGLKRANFLGGEPFLIPIYYDLWDAILEINPNVDVAITSNGTALNSRSKNMIEKLPNLRITLSIDSLQQTTWESIRLNGNFASLQQNLNYLLSTGKLVSFSVCPMIQNRMEIPEIVAYCQKNQLEVYFNTVYEPLGGRIKGIHEKGHYDPLNGSYKNDLIPETSLQCLSTAELEKLIEYYTSFSFEGRLQMQMNALIQQIKSWREASLKKYAE